jgi:hypothetical protein
MIETTRSISSASSDVPLERRVWMRISGNLSVSEEGGIWIWMLTYSKASMLRSGIDALCSSESK